MVLNIANSKIITGARTGIKNVLNSSARGSQAAKRAASMQKLGAAKTKYASGKGYITGGCKPIIEQMEKMSDNVSTITKTLKSVKRNITKANKNKDVNKSLIGATVEGIKQSSSQIKGAIKEISGVNDVVAASKEGGLVKGALEVGKATARVTASTTLFVAGNFVPAPGMSILGWLAGEKLANLLLGKPFTKQIPKLLK